MKNKIYLILSIISFVLGGGSFGIFLIMALLGSVMCFKPFQIVNGGEGPILSCTSIFNTEYVWPFIIGICLLIVGIILIIIYKKRKRGKNEK